VTTSSWLNFGRPAPPTPGKGGCGGTKSFGSALLQPARSVCVSLSAFFIYVGVSHATHWVWRSMNSSHHDNVNVSSLQLRRRWFLHFAFVYRFWFWVYIFISDFYRATHAMRKRGLCCCLVAVRPSVRLSRWCIVSTRLKISSNSFDLLVASSF